MVARRGALLRYLFLLSLAGLCGCAKESEPQPPQVLVPKPAIDLNARQFGARIALSVSLPVENTNGSRTVSIGRVEIFRLAGDRASTTPLTQDAYLEEAERIQSIPAAELAHYLHDGTLSFEDAATDDPASLYTRGFRYAVRFINRRNQTAGLSNQVFMAPVPIPAAPTGLSSELFRDHIRLFWKQPERNENGSAPVRIAGYNIYRTESPANRSAQPLNTELLSKPEFEDRSFDFDKTYYYAVSVVGTNANPYAESLQSAALAVQATDKFPPGSPKALTAVEENGIVTLLWTPPDDPDVAGYRVYRKEEGTKEPILLQAQLVTVLSFRDDQVRTGKKYEYSVAAVDTHGNVGQAATTTVEVR